MALSPRLVLLLLAVAVAFAGLALGAHLQKEDALPADPTTQQLDSDRGATGNVIAITALVVAAGTTWAATLLWPAAKSPRQRSRRRTLLAGAALFAGMYLLASLVQTAWPYYIGLQMGTHRQASLSVNLLASDTPALPSVMVPVFAAWIGALLLAFWGLRARNDPENAMPTDGAALLRRQTGVVLLSAPLLGLAAWGCLRLLVVLPPVPGATPYRVLLSLAALAFAGLLVAGAAKTWHLMRAVRDNRLVPLSQEGWQGLGRVEIGLAGLLGILAVVVLLLPAFPPATPSCHPLDPKAAAACSAADPTVQYHDELQDIAALLQSGQTFGTRLLRVHVDLLMLALLPLVPAIRLQRRVATYLEQARPQLAQVPAHWSATLAAALSASFLLGGLCTFLAAGSLWAWVAAALPLALAARILADWQSEGMAILTASGAAWAMGNSLVAQYDLRESGLLQFVSNPSFSTILRLAGAMMLAWAVARLLRQAAGQMRTSLRLPLVAGTALCALAVALLELPLDIWTNNYTDTSGTAHASSVFVGTAVARLDAGAAIAVHMLCLTLSLAGAAMAARLLRPGWFQRGREGRGVAAASAAAT